MKSSTYYLSTCVALFSCASLSVPLCQNANENIDADGWGWENGVSCVVPGSSAAVSLIPQCGSLVIDYDSDGWGYENGESCLVGSAAYAGSVSEPVITEPQASLSHTPDISTDVAEALSGISACGLSVVDYDGDGWGYENGASCLIGGVSAYIASLNGGDNGTESVDFVSQSVLGATPTGVQFRNSTLRRVGGTGDNWCQTWAADGSVITAMDDGDWFNGGRSHHSRLYRIDGDADNFSRSEVTEYPDFARSGDGWFAYGMLSVKGVLYSLVSKTQGDNWSSGPFRGMKMLRSYDSGESWFRVDRYNNDRYLERWDIGREELGLSEMFFFEEYERWGKGKNAYPFSYASFVQSGQDHRSSQDGYVYVYSPEGASSNQLMLARVPEDEVGNRSAWRYFTGWDGANASWSANVESRQPSMVLPERNNAGEYFGWYSWLPSVVWNPGLQKYIMVNGGTYAGRGLSDSTRDYYNAFVHEKSGSLGFWYSDTPYGPWTEIYYTDYWTADSAENMTYQPKLSPKWISEDGRTMTLIWSDGMLDAEGSTKINYMWNQMEIEIQTR